MSQTPETRISAFSRKAMGEALASTELVARASAMERSSTALLRALWTHHKPILMTLYAQGRRVVRP